MAAPKRIDMNKVCGMQFRSLPKRRALHLNDPSSCPRVRIHPHGSHAIVYLIRDDHILIVRILRADADRARHL